MISTPRLQQAPLTSVSFYVFGNAGLRKQQRMIPSESASKLRVKFQELRTALAADPFGQHTQRLKQDFINLLAQNNLIPASISPSKYHTLLNPPWATRLLQHHAGAKRASLPVGSGIASAVLCDLSGDGVGLMFPFIMLPRPRIVTAWMGNDGDVIVGKFLTIGGFHASGQQFGTALGFWGIGFAVAYPEGNVYGFAGYALFVTVTADNIEKFPLNQVPIITRTDPANNEQDVPVSLSKLSFTINDPEGDLMNFTVTTNPDIGSANGNLKPGGTYTVPVHGLQGLTQYSWTISVNDAYHTTEQTFSFTTQAVGPVVSNPSPKDHSLYVPIETTNVSFDLKDNQGALMNWTVETQPNVGSGSGTNVADDHYTVNISSLAYFTTYTWFVNATDGENKVSITFVFRTTAEGTLVFEPTDDAYVASGDGNQNTGASESMSIRSGGYDNYWWAAPTIKFDLSSHPPGAVVLSATLNIYYYDYADGNPVGRPLVMYRFLGDWNEETITWNNMPSINPTQSTLTHVPNAPGTWISWDVTNDVQRFFNGTAQNYGWIIKDEASSGLPLTYLRSKEYPSAVPYLIVEINTTK